MSQDHIRKLVLRQLQKIAPEVDIENINPDARFRDQLEFDSIDYLNLMKLIREELQIEISEIEYPKLATLNGCIQYLSGKL